MSAVRARELLGGGLDRSSAWLGYATRGQIHRRRTFVFDGETYHYHAAAHNRTWTNERAVELPIVTRAVARAEGGRVLEVGNVLRHYGVSGHTVVDKYEVAPGVLNQDILDFHDARGFGLIVSVSTIEHIGFDEEAPEPDKPARTAAHLASLLAPGGIAILTFPLGYNPGLDALVASQPQTFGEIRALRRVSADNRWVEADVSDLLGAPYGSPYPRANALVVARMSRS